MPKVRNLQKSAARFQERAGRAVQEYVDGVMENDDWEAKTVAGQQLHDIAMQKAAAKKSFSKGVKKAGGAKYKKGVQDKGAARFQQGTAIAGPEWEAGFAPFQQTIEAVQLPARGPKGTNYGRVEAVGEALRKKKEAMQG